MWSRGVADNHTICSAHGKYLASRSRKKIASIASDYILTTKMPESSDLVIFVLTDNTQTGPITLPLAHMHGVTFNIITIIMIAINTG